MKRVLQIMGGLNRGGLETFVLNIYRKINRNEIQFDFLLTQQNGGDYANEVKAMGARIFSIPSRNKGYKVYKKALDSFFKEHHDYIAIHEHISSLTSIEPAYYAKKYGIQVRIFHSHSSSIQRSLRLHWVHTILHYFNKPKVRNWATHYLGCSDKALDWMYKYTGVRSRSKMINNGIDCAQYAFNDNIRKNMRANLGIGVNDFVIGHVGRFIPLKNQKFLVDILKEMQKIIPSTKLLLVGEGDTMEEVKNKVESKGLINSVIFTGLRSDVMCLMQAMDVFAMPSWFEGLPVTLVEAQASGLPIIASDTISRNSNLTGTVLFKSINESAVEWAQSIINWQNMYGRPQNKEKLINAGFDSETIVLDLMEIYNGRL